MYKIGEFSRITELTVKALRHYHEEGLLAPFEIDSLTSYRYYNIDQIGQAKKIKLLRDCNFSIKEVKEIINHSEDLEDLPFYLDEKITSILKDVKKVKVIKMKLLDQLNENRGEIMRSYQVIKKKTEKQLVISTKYVGKYEDCGKYMGILYKTAKQHSTGVPINLYYDSEYKVNASIEVCVPVKKEIKVKKDILLKELPSVDGISTIHIGPYDKVGNAYQALSDYAKSEGFDLGLPLRETYLKGPGMLFKGNPNKYQTEVFIPIIKSTQNS